MTREEDKAQLESKGVLILGRLWSDQEKEILLDLIKQEYTTRQIFESGLLPGRSFRSIKDKRSEIALENKALSNPKFVSADYASRKRTEVIIGLKEIYNIDEDIEDIVRFKEGGYTYQQISVELGVSYRAVKTILENWSIFKRVFNTTFGRDPLLQEVFLEKEEMEELEREYEFEELWGIFNNWIERKRSTIKLPDYGQQESGNLKKHLIIQDTHIPYHDEDFLVEIIEKHKHEVDTLFIAGDFLDCYSVSPFPKYKDITLKEELTEAVKILQYLSQNIRNIKIITGNHDKRVYKSVYKQLDKNMIFLVNTNLLDFVAKGFALETIGEEFSNVEVIDNWYYQVGDAIIGHPELYSSVQLTSAVKSYEWFKRWQGRLNLNDFRLVTHAHTHKAGTTYVEESGRLHMIIETGACCEVQEYAIKGESRGKYTPPQNGYVLLIQDDGETVFNETRLIIQDVNEKKE